MTNTILTDTCFWLGLVDPKDQYHELANAIAELIEGNQIIIPWPCLYETISTHLTRRRDRLIFFEQAISKPNIILLDDELYKKEGLNKVFEHNKFFGKTYSLTDSIIREILKDIDFNVKYFVTFNIGDFQDICDMRRIEILSN